MHIELDSCGTSGPNPPPWEVHYVNDKVEHPLWYNGVLPEAHTHGILDLDLQVRLVSPNLAAALLDNFGIWLLKNNARARPGDVISFQNKKFILTPSICICNGIRPILRLAWESDPLVENVKISNIFELLCKKADIVLA